MEAEVHDVLMRLRSFKHLRTALVFPSDSRLTIFQFKRKIVSKPDVSVELVNAPNDDELIWLVSRFDLIVLFGGRNKLQQTHYLSRLRDFSGARIFYFDDQGVFQLSELLALGFKEHLWEGSRLKSRWYSFDLDCYKKTPDWFNSDHWAHPELWDQYRW